MRTAEYGFYKPEYRARIPALLKYCSISNALERAILRDESASGGKYTFDVNIIERQAINRTQRKLHGIGMTLSDYAAALSAFAKEDIPKLRSIASKANENVANQKKGRKTTAEEFFIEKNSDGKPVYKPEREALHEKIIEKALEGKLRKKNPKLLVIAGPPGSGKSSERERFIEDNDDAVFSDPDEIRHYLIKNYDPQDNAHVQLTYQESHDVADKIFRRAIELGYNIIFEGTLRYPDGHNNEYGDGLGPNKAIEECLKKEYEIQAAFVHAPLEECFRRAIVHRDRGVLLSVLLDSVTGFNNFLKLTKSMPEIKWWIRDNTEIGKTCSKQIEKEDEEEIQKIGAYYNKFVETDPI